MAKAYDYRTNLRIISGGYPGEETGVIPSDTSWHSTTELSGSKIAEYYYRDSDTLENANSSRVVVKIRDDWTANIDSQNNLTISVTTTIESIVRDNIRGNPGQLGRDMRIRRRPGGSIWWSGSDNSISVAKTIATNIVLATHTFTLPPGGMFSQSTVYFENFVPGHGEDPLPSIYVDEMNIGLEFRNPLPKDYRPGAVLDTDNGVWLSHNRTGGKCHILTADNGSWAELRTQGGDAGEKGNPPSILRADNGEWFNQRLIGKE